MFFLLGNFTRAHVPWRDYHGYYSYVKIEKRRCAAKKEKNIPDSTNGIYIVYQFLLLSEQAGWCLGSKKPSWGWHFFWGTTNVWGEKVNPRVILVHLLIDFHTQPFRWVQNNLGDSVINRKTEIPPFLSWG